MAIIDFSAGGRSYKFVTDKKNAIGAASHAKELGGYIVNLETTAESSAVYDAITGLIATGQVNPSDSTAADGGGGSYAWLGGTDNVWSGWPGAAEGSWRWKYSGTALSTTRSEWGRGTLGSEPDNVDQHYLALGLTNWPAGSSAGNGFGDAGQWNDIGRDNVLFYVVEMTPLA